MKKRGRTSGLTSLFFCLSLQTDKQIGAKYEYFPTLLCPEPDKITFISMLWATDKRTGAPAAE